jgi:hypothetical protein
MIRFLYASLILWVGLSLGACVGTAKLQIEDGPESLRSFSPTARTIGGPGFFVASKCVREYDETGDGYSPGDLIFNDLNHSMPGSGRNPRSVCVTIENLGKTNLVVTFLDDLRMTPISTEVWLIERSRVVGVGQSKTFCDRTSLIGVACEWQCEEPDCHRFRWRVDMHVP